MRLTVLLTLSAVLLAKAVVHGAEEDLPVDDALLYEEQGAGEGLERFSDKLEPGYRPHFVGLVAVAYVLSGGYIYKYHEFKKGFAQVSMFGPFLAVPMVGLGDTVLSASYWAVPYFHLSFMLAQLGIINVGHFARAFLSNYLPSFYTLKSGKIEDIIIDLLNGGDVVEATKLASVEFEKLKTSVGTQYEAFLQNGAVPSDVELEKSLEDIKFLLDQHSKFKFGGENASGAAVGGGDSKEKPKEGEGQVAQAVAKGDNVEGREKAGEAVAVGVAQGVQEKRAEGAPVVEGEAKKEGEKPKKEEAAAPKKDEKIKEFTVNDLNLLKNRLELIRDSKKCLKTLEDVAAKATPTMADFIEAFKAKDTLGKQSAALDLSDKDPLKMAAAADKMMPKLIAALAAVTQEQVNAIQTSDEISSYFSMISRCRDFAEGKQDINTEPLDALEALLGTRGEEVGQQEAAAKRQQEADEARDKQQAVPDNAPQPKQPETTTPSVESGDDDEENPQPELNSTPPSDDPNNRGAEDDDQTQ